jgi:hypothetical protein
MILNIAGRRVIRSSRGLLVRDSVRYPERHPQPPTCW